MIAAKSWLLARRRRGSTLVLMLSVTLCLLVGLGLVGLQFAKLLGSKHEHVNATEAAALAGAQALSRIVIEDRNVGFVSASDYPPTGTDTIAGDGYTMPVIGINTLAATVRLDNIIADQLDDVVLKRLALNDYYDYIYAASLLREELYRCSQDGQLGKDINGESVGIYKEARKAYLDTYQKMTGRKPTDSGFEVQLGYVAGLTTNTPIPSPSQFAFMDKADQDQGYYKSCVNVPYANRNYSFAPATEKLTLVDPVLFELRTPAMVGGSVPTVVKVHSQQNVEAINYDAAKNVDTIASDACAYGGIMREVRNRPGVLFLSFDGGNYTGLRSLKAVLNDEKFCLSPTDMIESPLNSDSPPDDLVLMTPNPFSDPHPPFGQVMRMAFYDWVRRNRCQLNVQSLMDQMEDTFAIDKSTSGNFYWMNGDGSVSNRSLSAAGVNRLGLMAVGHKQFRAVSGIARDEDDDAFDIIVKDYVRYRGRVEGGKHGGEPYPWAGGTVEIVSQPRKIDDEVSKVYVYPALNGNIKRPAWSDAWGVCCEIRIRKR